MAQVVQLVQEVTVALSWCHCDTKLWWGQRGDRAVQGPGRGGSKLVQGGR